MKEERMMMLMVLEGCGGDGVSVTEGPEYVDV